MSECSLSPLVSITEFSCPKLRPLSIFVALFRGNALYQIQIWHRSRLFFGSNSYLSVIFSKKYPEITLKSHVFYKKSWIPPVPIAIFKANLLIHNFPNNYGKPFSNSFSPPFPTRNCREFSFFQKISEKIVGAEWSCRSMRGAASASAHTSSSAWSTIPHSRTPPPLQSSKFYQS